MILIIYIIILFKASIISAALHGTICCYLQSPPFHTQDSKCSKCVDRCMHMQTECDSGEKKTVNVFILVMRKCTTR